MEFNLDRMKKLVEQDLLLLMMVKGLGNDDKAYEVVFNSEVLEDAIMEDKYNSIQI